MAPRKYTMDKRKAAVEETRQRILEATLALHSEKGIFGTSWQDIAHRADVSVGTVYKHFPSLDELVPPAESWRTPPSGPLLWRTPRRSLPKLTRSRSASGV